MMAARDRVRRSRALGMTPRERLAAMWRLIAEANELKAAAGRPKDVLDLENLPRSPDCRA